MAASASESNVAIEGGIPENKSPPVHPNPVTSKPNKNKKKKNKGPRVCKFFQVGTCRYGEACKFAHIKAVTTKPNNNKKSRTNKASSSRAPVVPLAPVPACGWEEEMDELMMEMHMLNMLADDSSDDGGCFGFSEDDVMELAAQGVKPWDPDAPAVLAALNGCFDYY